MTIKRTMTILTLVAMLAIGILGTASGAVAAKGGRQGEFTIALRAPKGVAVTFDTTAGPITLTGNSNATFDADRWAFVEPVTVDGEGTLSRVHTVKGDYEFVNPETGYVAAAVNGGVNPTIRYVYR